MTDNTTPQGAVSSDTGAAPASPSIEPQLQGDASPADPSPAPTSPPDWREGFSDDMKSSLEKFKTPEDLANSYKQLQGQYTKMTQGKEAIFKPGENATQEEIDAYYTELGRPEGIEGYDLKLPEGMPEGFLDSEDVNWFREFAFKQGLPKDKAEAMFEAYNTRQVEQMKVLDETLEAELLNKYGENYKQQLNGIIEASASPETAEKLMALDNHSLLLMTDLLMNVSKNHLEEGKIPASGGGVPGMTLPEIDARIAEIQGMDLMHNKHKDPHQFKALTKERIELFEKRAKIKAAN